MPHIKNRLQIIIIIALKPNAEVINYDLSFAHKMSLQTLPNTLKYFAYELANLVLEKLINVSTEWIILQIPCYDVTQITFDKFIFNSIANCV